MPAINLCLYLFVAAATVVIYGTARLVHEISAEWQREREWDLAHERPSGNARHDGGRHYEPRREYESVIWNGMNVDPRTLTDQELGEEIRKIQWWDHDLCTELARRAGLETEWENSDDETFEHVLFSAAEILGIELL